MPANLLNQNQQIGALYDWVAIGRKINPQNPKAGLETYLKFLGEFEQSAEGREFQRKREKLQSQLPKHVDKKIIKNPHLQHHLHQTVITEVAVERLNRRVPKLIARAKEMPLYLLLVVDMVKENNR